MVVPDVIDHDLRVLFVGVNPGVRSGETQHHFAHPSGRLWKALQAAGFMPEVLNSADEEKLLEYRLGLTNLVHRPTPSAELLRGRSCEREPASSNARLASTSRSG
jgi:TDG/mug DNA glycosylase family protein